MARISKRQHSLTLLAAVLFFAASVVSFIAGNRSYQDVLGDYIDLPETLETLSVTNSPSLDDQPVFTEQTDTSDNRETVVVARVVDGDTIVLTDGRKVRYIGIDTPETKHPTKPVQCYGERASERNRELVAGQTITMERDVSDTDRYGRLLRYVYLGETMINELLVSEGYAKASTYPPDVKYQELFAQAENEARQEQRGLWSSECQED